MSTPEKDLRAWTPRDSAELYQLSAWGGETYAVDDRGDITLSPEELGRVRLTVSAAETGITVSIQAERPDTLDLLRRHGDALIADLAAEGFADASLDFGRDSRSGSDAGPDAAGEPLHTDTEPPREAIRPSRQTSLPQGRSIDLRL